jgi:hypothetical protein
MKFGFAHMSQDARDKLESLGVPVRNEDSQITMSLVEHQDTLGVRVWLHPDDNVYYYLVRGTIFKMIPDRVTVGTTTTEHSTFILAADQQEYRGLLEDSRPPVTERPI